MTEHSEAIAGRRPRRARRRIAVAFAGIALVAALTLAWMRPDIAPWRAEPPPPAAAQAVEPLLDTQLMPVSIEEAERLNALRPVDVVEVAAARPFDIGDRFRADPRFASAVDCLSQAIYYEAASESESGQRAVAQVVLNRVRHPAFPNTVCGVVYQGSELATGCQFTFTCDGSLARAPSHYGWARARQIALAALSGWVEPAVGTATHYHASYVLPYWAGSLDKVRSIGMHIFYAMRGSMGSRAAFVARYDLSGEYVPVSRDQPMIGYDFGVVDAAGPEAMSAPQMPLTGLEHLSPPQGPAADAPVLRTAPTPALRADEEAGELIVGGGNAERPAD